MSTILDGKKLAQQIKDQLKREVQLLAQKYGERPHLVNLMIGDDAGSRAYANAQIKAAEYCGIGYELKTYPLNITQAAFEEEIIRLNENSRVNGIMLHKPVPKQIDYHIVANLVDTDKDLEGINVKNIGKMLLGETNIIPCTPAAVMEHIRSTGVPLRGKEAVIVGHSVIVGKPLALLLLEEYATVTVCHVATSEANKLKEHVSRADILAVAVGKAHLIKGDWIKKGAIVIDVGINRVGDSIVGDVEFDKAKERASFITPVPGGVGPVTVVMLMHNGVQAFKQQREIKEKLRV